MTISGDVDYLVFTLPFLTTLPWDTQKMSGPSVDREPFPSAGRQADAVGKEFLYKQETRRYWRKE